MDIEQASGLGRNDNSAEIIDLSDDESVQASSIQGILNAPSVGGPMACVGFAILLALRHTELRWWQRRDVGTRSVASTIAV